MSALEPRRQLVKKRRRMRRQATGKLLSKTARRMGMRQTRTRRGRRKRRPCNSRRGFAVSPRKPPWRTGGLFVRLQLVFHKQLLDSMLQRRSSLNTLRNACCDTYNVFVLYHPCLLPVLYFHLHSHGRILCGSRHYLARLTVIPHLFSASHPPVLVSSAVATTTIIICDRLCCYCCC